MRVIRAIVFVFVVFLLTSWIFYITGGRGLVRVTRHYLMRDLPDKIYNWSDFLPNNDSKQITGFYSSIFSSSDTVAIWTLTGLNRFYNLSDKSVYYYRDACGVIREVSEKKTATQPVANPYAVYLDIAKWQEMMKSEYMVTVKWAEQDNKKVVDKLWGVSGRYKIPGRIGEGVCD